MGWYADAAAYRANVTPCSYLVGSDGVWTTQLPNSSVAAMAAGWTARFTNELGLQVSPLLAASGTGMNAAIANATLGDALIAASVAEARALGLTGFNLQLEEPGSAVIQAQWRAFRVRWLSALGPNVTLSVIIGGVCRARDWMWMKTTGSSRPMRLPCHTATCASSPRRHTRVSHPRGRRTSRTSCAAFRRRFCSWAWRSTSRRSPTR